MKNFMTLVAVIFALFIITPDAHAKKFGGKRSFGKSHNTATQTKKAEAPKSANAAKKSNKKGLMGGLLGGLLAGGLIAALMGGAFEGLQMMDIIIMAAIAFILFKVFKSMSQAKASAQQPRTAYAGDTAQFKQAPTQPAASTGGFSTPSSDVPFNLPAGFDLTGFLEGARSHYKTLQQAWNDNDIVKIQEYVSNELYNELSKERSELTTTPNTQVMFLDAELVRAETSANLAELSVKFSGRYRDEDEGLEEDINEVWHLERRLDSADTPWLIVGIEQ